MDIRSFESLLRALEQGDVQVIARDLTEPSPLALEALNARPYAFLDDAPLEERRTQAVMSRRWIDPAAAADLGRLDEKAIERVREEAWPDAASADELHDALQWLTFVTEEERRANPAWPKLMDELVIEGRAVALRTASGDVLWAAVERRALFEPAIPSSEESMTQIVRGRLEGVGPTTPEAIADSLGISPAPVSAALAVLEHEGFALRGSLAPGA